MRELNPLHRVGYFTEGGIDTESFTLSTVLKVALAGE
jgi:hypothetical protein